MGRAVVLGSVALALAGCGDASQEDAAEKATRWTHKPVSNCVSLGKTEYLGDKDGAEIFRCTVALSERRRLKLCFAFGNNGRIGDAICSLRPLLTYDLERGWAYREHPERVKPRLFARKR